MADISELTNKLSALKIFKDQILLAIKDEQEAQRIYDKMMLQADACARADSSQIRGIRDQERDHEYKFKNMLKNTEVSIDDFERKLKDEQRRLADQQRREQEAQRARRRGSGY